jgi:hypothetical protein
MAKSLNDQLEEIDEALGESSSLLAPLMEALRRYVLSADKLHGDDTPVPVLAPGTGKTKTGRLWTYVRDDRPSGSLDAPAVWFAYSPDRKGGHPQRHLAGFRGILQADAYAGFNKLYEDGSIQEAPCMAHIRRKFYDLMEAHQSPIATEAIERIALLYAIEKENGRSPDERRRVRNARARPLIESMHLWLQTSLATLSRKSDTAAAIHYALSLWDAMVRYLDDGRIEIDNSAAERALRAVAVGRRNYLFAGSDRGGERAAVFYTLIGSAKLNGRFPGMVCGGNLCVVRLRFGDQRCKWGWCSVHLLCERRDAGCQDQCGGPVQGPPSWGNLLSR